MFYGLIVSLYYFDNKHHHLPYIHVSSSGMEAVFSIEWVELMDGNLPKANQKLVEAWSELRRKGLMADG